MVIGWLQQKHLRNVLTICAWLVTCLSAPHPLVNAHRWQIENDLDEIPLTTP